MIDSFSIVNLRYQVDLNSLTLLVPEERELLVCLFCIRINCTAFSLVVLKERQKSKTPSLVADKSFVMKQNNCLEGLSAGDFFFFNLKNDNIICTTSEYMKVHIFELRRMK